MNAYDRLTIARSKGRPTAASYLSALFTDFFELHGDRLFGDDRAILSGVARLDGLPVTVIAIEKGVDTKEKVDRNFGSVHPEGYRKALRLMRQAEKFHRPVVLFVDTSGAYCGIGAEERGQGSAIAQNLVSLSGLKTPCISILIGEGGSGGALALAVCDEVWMLENAVYSVLSPEGAASIIWKDSSKVQEACEALKITAQDMAEMGIVEKVFPEPPPDGDFAPVYSALKDALKESLRAYAALSTEELLARRYEKFRKIGRPTL